MKKIKKAEEYLEQIELYMEHEDHDKPEYDMKMESLLPVLAKYRFSMPEPDA